MSLFSHAERSVFPVLKGMFVVISMCARVGGAWPVVCLLFVCVGCLTSTELGLRKMPLLSNDHGNS